MRIRKFFLTQEERKSVTKEIRCGEFVAGCAHVSRGETEAELMRAFREHARDAHGMTEIDEVVRAGLFRAIQER